MRVEINMALNEFANGTSAYRSLLRKGEGIQINRLNGDDFKVDFLIRNADLTDVLGDIALLQKYIIHSKIKITA